MGQPPVPAQQGLYGAQTGYPPQPDPHAYAGQPLPEIPAHPPMAMRPPTAQAYPAIPQATGAVPPPAERRQWFNRTMFGGPGNADPGARADERQKRMSMNEDNTNLKKQVSSTGKATRSEDEATSATNGAIYRTDPTSVASMSSVSGNISHSASLEGGISTQQSLRTLNTLDMSTLEERLDTGRRLTGKTGTAPSPISPLDPQGISTPTTAGRTAESVTPPRSTAAGPITLGSGFTPLKVSDLFGGGGSESESESDGTPTKPRPKKSNANGTSASGNNVRNSETSDEGSARSGAPSGDTQRNGSAPGTPSRDGSLPSGLSEKGATSEPSASASTLTPSKFDLRGKTWSETEQSISSHASAPSVSEPLAGIELPKLPPRPPPKPAPEVEIDVPEIGPDWLDLEPDYLGLADGQVFLHHCGSLRVLERVIEEDEEPAAPPPAPAPRVVWAEKRGRPRRGSGSAPRSPLSGEQATPRVSPTARAAQLARLPDMDEYLASSERESGEAGAAPAGALGLALGPAIELSARAPRSGSSSASGSSGESGVSVAVRTGAARSARSAPPLAVRSVVVIDADGSGT